MSDTNAQEPTMEEILASIRRIISEDDAPASSPEETPPAAVVAAEASAPEPTPAPEPPPVDDDVLELTEPLQQPPAPEPEPVYAAPPPPPQTLGDLDVSTAPTSPPPPPASTETLVGGQASEAAASMFGQLSRTVTMPTNGQTLEEVVTALLRPLLKDWLDRNLPGIVEAKVQAEVERISRSHPY